jgi:hypothetical protein
MLRSRMVLIPLRLSYEPADRHRLPLRNSDEIAVPWHIQESARDTASSTFVSCIEAILGTQDVWRSFSSLALGDDLALRTE